MRLSTVEVSVLLVIAALSQGLAVHRKQRSYRTPVSVSSRIFADATSSAGSGRSSLTMYAGLTYAQRIEATQLSMAQIFELRRARRTAGAAVDIRDLLIDGLAHRTPAGDPDPGSIASMARALATALERKADEETLPTR